jgi:hypothetical protein
MAVAVTAPVWMWNAEKGRWHFLTIGPDAAVEIRLAAGALGSRRGFGSVRVQARIGDTAWKTSLFPSRENGGYVLPIKADVRRREGITAGEPVTVEIDVI